MLLVKYLYWFQENMESDNKVDYSENLAYLIRLKTNIIKENVIINTTALGTILSHYFLLHLAYGSFSISPEQRWGECYIYMDFDGISL